MRVDVDSQNEKWQFCGRWRIARTPLTFYDHAAFRNVSSVKDENFYAAVGSVIGYGISEALWICKEYSYLKSSNGNFEYEVVPLTFTLNKIKLTSSVCTNLHTFNWSNCKRYLLIFWVITMLKWSSKFLEITQIETDLLTKQFCNEVFVAVLTYYILTIKLWKEITHGLVAITN